MDKIEERIAELANTVNALARELAHVKEVSQQNDLSLSEHIKRLQARVTELEKPAKPPLVKRPGAIS
jgi:tetrahydromethanopterin S-methyltransferase subunit B